MIILWTLLGIFLCGDLAWWWNADKILRSRSMLFSRLFVGAFMSAQIAGLGLSIFLDRTGTIAASHLMPKKYQIAVYLWHFLVLLPVLALWAIFAMFQGIRRARLKMRAPEGVPRPSIPATQEIPGGNRRQFLAAAAATAPSLFLFGTSGVALYQLGHFRVRRLSLSLAQLPPELDGLTIAHVSDLHLGRFTHGKILEEVVRVTNDLHADLVLQTGDLINYSLADLPPALELMSALKAPHGVFLCEGNHDLYQKDQRSLVVSNGIGNWFPLRMRAPAEIVHLTLRRASTRHV